MSEIPKIRKLCPSKDETKINSYKENKPCLHHVLAEQRRLKILNIWRNKNLETTYLGGSDVDIKFNTLGVVPEGTSDVKDIAAKQEGKEKEAAAEAIIFKNYVSSILEKFDTTLVEIQKETSKGLVEMLSEVHAKVEKLKAKRRLLNQQFASELRNGVLRVIAEFFSEMEKRSQELDKQIMTELKDDIRKIFREDHEKKKAMIRLLREDVQAVMDKKNEDP